MRKLPRLLLGILIALSLSVGCLAIPAKAGTQDFSIRSFNADYYVGRDDQKISQLKVEEVIVAEFPQFDQNHGILRAIPKKYKGHSLYLNVDKVTKDNGTAWDYSDYSENDNLVLQIGDEDAFVRGVQTYRISYTMKYVTTNFDAHDEWFWDINGDQWQQPFGRVEAKVHIPADLRVSLKPEQRCYTGANNSQEQACTISRVDGLNETLLTIRTSRTLTAGETMSVAVGFNKDTFAPYKKPTSEIIALVAKIVVGGVMPPVIALIIMIRKWRRFGRDPKGRGTIIPEYLPPKEVSVVGCEVVLTERFHPAAISAQIIDLAVRHYLIIYEVAIAKKFRRDETTYEIELQRLPASLRQEEKEVIDLLFGKSAKVGERVNIKDSQNKLYKEATAIGEGVSARLADEGYFAKEPKAAKRPYIIWGAILLVLGIVSIPFLAGLGFLVAGAIVMIGSTSMPARTLKGVHLHDYLKGLKMYMEVAEAQRLRILQAPGGKLTQKIDTSDKKQLVKLYEKLLPYAMLMGIEKEWAKQFASLYDSPPDWYQGSNTSAFNAAYFVGAMSSFSRASNASFAPPADSSSSGFSGGGAGGGGGGGGGGGW